MDREKIHKLNISRRLRPSRFAFLVDPNENGTLLKILRTNSCLWGGIYNPIIPCYRSLPQKWWNRVGGLKIDNAHNILEHYIDFFEPDFLVVPKETPYKDFGFDPDRIIRLEDMLSKPNEYGMGGYGLQMPSTYEHLFKSQFQSIRRNRPSIISAKYMTTSDELLGACLIGSFPDQDGLEYFQSVYEKVFNPESIQMDSQLLERLNNRNFETPLDIGLYGIEEFHHHHYFPQIFIMDGESGLDLIDLWNFRSIYRKIIPIPYKHLENPVSFLNNIIRDSQGVLPGNRTGIQICPNIMFSRSISLSEAESLLSQIVVFPKYHRSIQSWFPPFWENAKTPYRQYSRVTLKAVEKTSSVDINTSSLGVEFKALYPSFGNTVGSRFACANVVKINNNLSDANIALLYPTDCKDSSFLKLQPLSDPLISTSEGLVVFPSSLEETNYWTLSDGATAFQNWFDRYGIKTSPSSAGRSTEQILRILPRPAALGSIRFKGVIEKLNKMASSASRSDNIKSFESCIKKAAKTGKNICHPLRTLINCNVVKLGRKVKCSFCDYWNWFGLKNLNENLECDHCRRVYNFPVLEPDNTDLSYWAYRVLGPFALRKYAEGGYSAALSIGFFRDFLASEANDKILWSQGLNFIFPNGEKYEADFILLFQQATDYESFTSPIMIFGEAKSFGKDRIEPSEINRLKAFAKKFPGSGIVISMLRQESELMKKEIKLLRELALWGKKYDVKKAQILAPVIILTADELLEHGRIVRSNVLENIRRYGPSKIHALATYTQNKYLGISPT